jgi:threonine/homoserine/homoserine lactone efflux protein
VYFLFFKKVKMAEDGTSPHHHLKPADYFKIFFAGYFMNTLNPGVIAFWFTWATAFAAMTIDDRMVLFATCLGVVFAADLLKVFLANKLRQKLTVKIIHRVNQLSGVVLIVFGIVLIAGLLFYRK